MLPFVAWAQAKWDLGLLVLHRIRRRFVVPLALWGGRDMVLLTNGQWVDGTVPQEHVRWRYDAEKHTLVSQGAEGSRLVRWPWLSIVCGDRDLSDFFQSLRLSAGQPLADDKAIMLFAHQKRWIPTGDLHIVRRDGSEETYVLGTNGNYVLRPVEEESKTTEELIEGINYIR